MEAQDYKKLVEALRCCIPNPPEKCVGCTYNIGNNECAVRRMMLDAAAAIEALQAEVQFYKALADIWQSSVENKERLLGLYRAEQAKRFYSATDNNGRINVNPCACMNIPVFPDSSENPNG